MHQRIEYTTGAAKTSSFKPDHELNIASEKDGYKALKYLGIKSKKAPLWHHLDPDSGRPESKHSKKIVKYLKAKGFDGIQHRDVIGKDSTISTAIFEPSKNLKYIRTVNNSKNIR